ncbi:MAG: diguanylate cyclase [Treponema sp.]|nr:diguanylate cyclase [Treponema sp.]
MTKFKYFIYKNKELVLYIILFFSHAIFAPVYKGFNFTNLFIYNTITAFIYGIFILLFNNSHKHFFILFSYIEILFYCLFITISTGADFGTRMFVIYVIPSLFFIAYSSKISRKYYVILTLIATSVAFVIIWWDFGRPESIFSGYITAVTINKLLYRVHLTFSTILSLLYIFYLSILTEQEIKRYTRKTHLQFLKMRNLADHDQLTNLMNRREINHYFKICETKKKLKNVNYAICIFDIDHFKSVNDKYGHDAGDFILQKISETVQKQFTEKENIARWGGEEFIILFEYYDNSIIEKLENFRMHIEKNIFSYKNIIIPITITLGLSSSNKISDIDIIIMDADNKLRYGKSNGRNQLVVSEDF